MSLDLSIHTSACPNACEHCRLADDRVFEWGYTYNISGMIRDAARIAGVYSEGHMLEGIEGRAGNYVEKLDKIITALKSTPDKYRAMNPSNGWGSYEELIPHLEKLLGALREWPDATVKAWR